MTAPTTILVVETMPTVRTMLTRLIGRVFPFAHVLEATKIAEARAVLEHTPVDVMLIDHYLPDGSSVDLLTALQVQGSSPYTIVMSPNPQDADAALAAGAAAFFAKPFEFPNLLAMLNQVITQ